MQCCQRRFPRHQAAENSSRFSLTLSNPRMGFKFLIPITSAALLTVSSATNLPRFSSSMKWMLSWTTLTPPKWWITSAHRRLVVCMSMATLSWASTEIKTSIARGQWTLTLNLTKYDYELPFLFRNVALSFADFLCISNLYFYYFVTPVVLKSSICRLSLRTTWCKASFRCVCHSSSFVDTFLYFNYDGLGHGRSYRSINQQVLQVETLLAIKKAIFDI